jgi:hypothetical protein
MSRVSLSFLYFSIRPIHTFELIYRAARQDKTKIIKDKNIWTKSYELLRCNY